MTEVEINKAAELQQEAGVDPTNVSWDEAGAKEPSKFINFPKDESEPLVITLDSWALVHDEFFKEKKNGFIGRVTHENGEPVEKTLRTPSKPFIRASRSVLEGRKGPITIRIIRIGSSYDTKFFVEEVKQ